MSAAFHDQLLRTAASAQLGRSFYEAFALYWQLQIPAWHALTPFVKKGWTDAATHWLVEQDPTKRKGPMPIITTGLRPILGGHIIGAIEPQNRA